MKSMSDDFADSFFNNTIMRGEKDIRVINSMIADLVRERDEIWVNIQELRGIIGDR